MSEILTIKNFGPIKDVTLEFRKVNILIGDQGTGKSTVAKLLSVIKGVSHLSDMDLRVAGKIAKAEERAEYFFNYFKDLLETYGIINYLKPDSFIEFSDSFNYLKYENKNILVKRNSVEVKDKHSSVIAYIPAYREAAVLLKDSLNAIAAIGTPLPKIFYFFGQNVINAKKAKSLYNYNDVLNVSYKYVGDNDIIVMKNGNEIPIEEASSAINSGIPLLLVFDNAVESNHPSDSRISHHLNCPYIIIEEPELNCFPTTQKKLMEYFISKIKYVTKVDFDYYCRLIITTHSPYILASLNNLMYAYKVGQEHNEETNNIIEKKYWINPDDVSAYILLQDGTYEDILDREENLIKAEKIDSVSNEINENFSTLINIEMSVKHEEY
ncbi:MAG: AAA family ATPase [Ginsengibacter sp.]